MKSEPTRRFDPEVFLAKAGHEHSISRYGSREVIILQGNRTDDALLIQIGKVNITVVSSQEKEVVIGILSASNFFGEGTLTGQQVRISTATAVDSCTIARLSRSVMGRTLHDEPAFSVFIAHLP